MSENDFQNSFSSLIASTTSLAAIGLALEQRTRPIDYPADFQQRLDDVIQALGGIPDEIDDATAAILAGRAYAALGGATAMFANPRRNGYAFHDSKLLASFGLSSAVYARHLLAASGSLQGLAKRLQQDATHMLDVGVGVAGQAIAMAGLFPRMKVTGIDIWAPSLEQARQNVVTAGLTERIEIVNQDVRSLSYRECFDLIKLPAIFIAAPVLTAALHGLHQSLRPGGWLVISINVGHDATSSALANLRTVAFGGSVWAQSSLQDELRLNGFVSLRVIPLPTGQCFLAGQRSSPTGS